MANPKEVLFWSIGLPGFGQFLNGKLIKGIVFIVLEILINVQGNFNKIIFYSFNGNIHQAVAETNYQWLMFYPCVYFYAMWDAYKDAGGPGSRFSYLPFVFCAYSVTVGLMYSPTLTIFGVILGPVWLPILSVIPGLIIGWIVWFIAEKCSHI